MKNLLGPHLRFYTPPELTRNYHGALALISSLVAWRLISNLPFIAFNSLKEADGAYKLVVVYLIAAGLIIYTGSVIAHNFALTYLHGMP
jgi:hypothetical protein